MNHPRLSLLAALRLTKSVWLPSLLVAGVAFLLPVASQAQSDAGTYRGTLHSYCPSFDYTNKILVTIGTDNSVSVNELSGETQYDSTGTIVASGTISGLNIRVNSLSRGNLTIPYSGKVGADGSITGSGSSGDIQVAISAVRVAGAFFGNEEALDNGVYYLSFTSGNYFGYYSYLTDARYIYHFDLGYEYVFDANDGNGGVYFYDFKSKGFFYTSPTFPFPYLYDFSLNSVVYYYPDPTNPGRYNTDGYRFFYVFKTGQTISK